MRKLLPIATAALCLLASPSSGAQDAVASAAVPAPEPETLRLKLDAGGPGAEWSIVVNRGSPELRLVGEGESRALEMRSSRASFGLQRKIALDLARFHVVSWRWRADVLPAGGDFRSQRTNDQAVQIYIAFSPLRAIGYIWDTSAPEGAVGNSPAVPPFMKVKEIVLRSGDRDRGVWELERRDLRADYELLFGEPMPDVKKLGIRLWINSQHTGSDAAGAFADLRFE